MMTPPLGHPLASSGTPRQTWSDASNPQSMTGTVGLPRAVSRRLGRRALGRLRQESSERDLAVLDEVARFRLLTSRQLEALHFADLASPLTAARTARRVLQRLVDHGLLYRLERRIGGLRAGSASFVYAITAAGEQLLDRDEALAAPRRRRREVGLPFVEHTLAIAELYVRLVAAARGDTGSEVLAVQAEPACWRRWQTYGGAREVLRPDLYLALGQGDDELRWFVEIDRGHEHLPTLRRKCAAYQAYYSSGQEQVREGVFPRVLWVMHSQRRAAALADLITRDRDLTTELFAVCPDDEAVGLLMTGASPIT